ncbi:IgGFc-binding protein-like [Cottoperca gobio]|uniref:IgGFc-binding protein-like n=1 Tax=Cottoperca gobio TaxID=56716 RepID=A0A6J2RCD3_COTGO|nr:IgGFc-binding protein-like [Cottoperca gobio]
MASDLLPFTVTTKNDHRGNRRVSFVRTVEINVHKQTIIIGRHRRQVQVNGELQYLPVSLLGGKVSVKQSGVYASLTTDFGLSVKYDWKMRLYITVPSSYYQHLGGLCGNYNGDRTDDLPETKGSRLSAVLSMIQKWKTNKSDRFCSDNCAGRCPTCSSKQQAHYRHPKLCGILKKPDGPFSACHKQVDPSMYLDNCVYDVCVNRGARQVLCDNLKSYDDACLSEEVKVNPQWRMVTKCCSHYEACGSACPPSCMLPDSQKLCKDPCVEGCQCNKGLVLSGDRLYDCKPVTCKKNEHCALKGGVRSCYPASYATCQGTGDPHYRSFDQQRFDFQGTCTYILSQVTKGSDHDLEPFQVLVQNENRGRNKAVSYTKSVSLVVFGNITVSMSRANMGKILVQLEQPRQLDFAQFILFCYKWQEERLAALATVLMVNVLSVSLRCSYVTNSRAPVVSSLTRTDRLEGGEVQCDPKFSCSANEKCVVKGGFSSCSPTSVGSCSVSGVRIVRSFDGQAYPLWGDCLFMLVEVEENKGGLEAFSVSVQQQTNKDGTVSRSVKLQVYDMEITMETGVVWEIKVDDIKVSLPVSLAEGNLRAHQNGINIIIESDFGLRLTYDSLAGVFLQVPSTYRSSPRGLCGNYTGELSDEPASAGEKPADAAAVWVIKKDDAPCETSCGAGSCPKQDGQKVPEAQKACDIIKSQQGPFAGCHSTVAPTPDYVACVSGVGCGSLSSLSGGSVWVTPGSLHCGRSVTCPAGSHYELCSSSCSSTCFSLQRSEPCPVCQEGCQCDDGLMSDGVRCVPVEKCGCSGASVLLEDCSERCVCQSGQFSCNSTSCQEGEECSNKDGTIGCYSTDPCADVECRVKEYCEVSEGQGVCVPDSKAFCWAFGDPHYTTFDGYTYSFQGTCSYVLVNTTGVDPSLPEVTVTTKNELRNNPEGSFVRSATVEMLGHRITIPSSDRGLILVDGIRTELPVLLEGGSISITQSGIRGTLQTDFGIEVTFDWATLVMVSISSSFYGNVAGLCGNYNGNKEDELTAAGGSLAANVTDWAGTWSVEDFDPFCYHHCDGVCPQCSAEDRKRYTGPDYCGILSDKKGPFSGCHGSVPVAEIESDCLYDVCTNEGRQEVLCEALSSYLAECQEAEASVLPWRQLVKCSVACPAHSHYELCGSACPASCGPQPEVCPQACVEGCFCDPGYIRSGTECVLKEKGCGCTHDGHYYLPGVIFWADSLCNEKCVCDRATQKARCEHSGCRTEEKCSVVNGVQDCYPISFKTCTARGDPHFRSFDGRKFDFQGNCVYKLASVCGDTTGLQPFEVNLENNNRGNKKVSYAKVVTVQVYGNTYTLSVDYPGSVLVDGLENFLPFSNSSTQTLVQVYHRHRLAVIETKFLKVSFDFASAVRVELATSYHSAACGLCGNFNDDPADDMTLPNGKLASNANEFGVSQWLADVEGCSHECKDCAQPLPPDFKPPSYTSVCDVITAQDGPLADCVDRVDSKQYHHDCIYDMVLNEGKQQSACDIISDYVEECQKKEGCVKSWRTRRLCWMQCAANSMYSVTAPGCPISCTGTSPPAECKTLPSEGCMCNPGYVLSQNRCVPLAECGCVFNGQYLVSGQKFYTKSDCQRLCECHGGMVTCKHEPCKTNESCGVQKGVRGCYADLKHGKK